MAQGERYWIVAMPLSESYLYVNCDSVINRYDRCPVCAAPEQQLLSLSRILNRTKPEEVLPS